MQSYIVFFDDLCVLCSRSVRFIYRHDRKRRFYFSSLESKAFREVQQFLEQKNASPDQETHSRSAISSNNGQHLKKSENVENSSLPDSVILYMNGKIYFRSSAALHIAARLRFPFFLLAAGFIVPAKIRDRIYDWIAKHRYRWFGKRETCFLPEGALRERFLD